MSGRHPRGLSSQSVVIAIVVAVVVAAGVVALILTLGAGGASPPSASEVLGPPDQTYTVAGHIAQLPTADSPDVYIAHAAVPNFVSREGEVVGMDAMTMPFTPAQSVDLTGFAQGDAIEFTFEVRWDSITAPVLVIRVEHADEP